MKRNPRKLIVPIIVVLLVIVGIWYFIVRPAGSLASAWNSLVNPNTPSATALTASGTVETTEIDIAPQEPGEILEVNVQEGDVVKAGEVLIHLDDTLLKIQRSIAASNLQATELVLQQLTSPTSLAVAQQNVAQDEQNLTNAQDSLNNELSYGTDQGALQNAQASLTLANNNLSNAQKWYSDTAGNTDKQVSKALAYERLYAAQQAYNTALTNYNWWAGRPDQVQIDLKTSALAFAKAKLAEDQTLVSVLSGNPIPAQATGTGIDQLRQAQINVQIAQSNLDLLDAEIGMMTVTAPVDGVVLTRNAEPGSVVNAGADLLTLGRLDELTLTVYVPEDRVGEVDLGESADVTVDSFPGVVFNGTVSYISDQAEFTPRNVETVSGRETTVFAVKLNLKDTSERLKPGMPADVVFDPK